MDKKPEYARLKEIVDRSTLLPLEAYSAYFIDKDGCFKDIMDKEIPMFSGVDLDGMSDWVDEHTYCLDEILYAK